MARYKFVDMSPRLLPVDLEAQLVPGTFAHAVHHLVDALDLSAFDEHYHNDEQGAPAYAPAMLLKAVLLAYSQGIVSSRAIERGRRCPRRAVGQSDRTDRAHDARGGADSCMVESASAGSRRHARITAQIKPHRQRFGETRHRQGRDPGLLRCCRGRCRASSYRRSLGTRHRIGTGAVVVRG
jgi:hypothetical protein